MSRAGAPLLLVLVVAGAAAAGAAELCGDTDGNGRRDAADRARLLRCADDPQGCEPARWDTNLDGALDAADAERVLRCDSGQERCACAHGTIRAIVLPDLQCLVAREHYACIDERIEARFGVRKTKKNRARWREIWRELQAREDFESVVDEYLEERLDVLDATVRGLLGLRPPPDVILAVGDLIHEGHGACGEIRGPRRARADAQWQRLLHNTRGRAGYAALLASEIPVVTAQGNHDECGFEQHVPGASPRKRADARPFDAKTGPGLALARHWGELPGESLWLQLQVAAQPGRPVFLVTHDQVQRLADGDCRWLGSGDFPGSTQRIVFVAGGHYNHWDQGCTEVESGRLLAFANFQQLERGGLGYFLELRVWPRAEPAFPAGSFELRTWSAYLGESWERPGKTGPGHQRTGRVAWP